MHFRELEVYQIAIQAFTLSTTIAQTLPRGHKEIRDQLRRASLSIPLNIAESSGKTQTADQKRFFAIARGSAMECAALVDVCRAINVAQVDMLDQLDTRLLSLVRMLSKLSR